MKHIKSYKIFESDWTTDWEEVSEHIQTIKDILLDLDDIGYYTSVSPTPLKLAKGEEPDIYVTITNEGSDNNKDIFEATKNRVIEYMKSNGWKSTIVKEVNIEPYVWGLSIDIRFER